MTKEMLTLSDVLRDEMALRRKLNTAQSVRDYWADECTNILHELNHMKIMAYRLGFTGNIMRDENGARIKSLDVLAKNVAD